MNREMKNYPPKAKPLPRCPHCDQRIRPAIKEQTR